MGGLEEREALRTDGEGFLRTHSEDKRSVETLDLLEASLDRLESAKGESARAKGVDLLKGLVEIVPMQVIHIPSTHTFYYTLSFAIVIWSPYKLLL